MRSQSLAALFQMGTLVPLTLLFASAIARSQEVRFASRKVDAAQDWHWPPPSADGVKAPAPPPEPRIQPPLPPASKLPWPLPLPMPLAPQVQKAVPADNWRLPSCVDESCQPAPPQVNVFEQLVACGGWLATLPVRILSPLGMAPVLPTSPGFYSFMDIVWNRPSDRAPHFPYSPTAIMAKSFFDADFRYLDCPGNTQTDIVDPLHSCRLGDNWLFSTGGEFRWRYHHEVDSRLTERQNNYNLVRSRLFADLWYRNDVRFFVELLDAHDFGSELAPLQRDVNRLDLLNAFLDVRVGECLGEPVFVRLGRQELTFGSQRLVSADDWSNTRTTMQGIRAFRAGESFDIDAFWVQPVVPDNTHADAVDRDVNFAGIWATWRSQPGSIFDLYYLFLSDDSPSANAGEDQGSPQTVHTLGSRYCGRHENLLWDVEAMVQMGQRGQRSIQAAAATAGAGYHCNNVPLNPTFWAYFDYASGDSNPDDGGDIGTFNQLFAFGHYYLGWIDLVGRRNIYDVNAHMYLYPTRWATVWLQYHHFELASARDALYNAAGVPIRRDASGRAGRNVGNELDVVINLHMSKHANVMVGYSRLFAGDFLQRTGHTSPEMLFLMYTTRW